jgi:hypothetical protein
MTGHDEIFELLASSCLDTETNQALGIIRKEGPKLVLDTIRLPFERRFIENLITFSQDQSGTHQLWLNLKDIVLDQFGLDQNTQEQVDSKARTIFHEILNNYFPRIIPPKETRSFKPSKGFSSPSPSPPHSHSCLP